VLFCGATVSMFVLPSTAMPARVNAIVVLGGPGNRLGLGLQLAQQGRAPYLLVSNGLAFILPAALCKRDHGSFTVICWNPDLGNTKRRGGIRRPHSTAVSLDIGGTRHHTRSSMARGSLRAALLHGEGLLSDDAAQLDPVALHDRVPVGATIKAETLQRGC
jgi:hypothetical protein